MSGDPRGHLPRRHRRDVHTPNGSRLSDVVEVPFPREQAKRRGFGLIRALGFLRRRLGRRDRGGRSLLDLLEEHRVPHRGAAFLDERVRELERVGARL